MGGSTICCHQFVLDCQRWKEVRFVVTSLCSIVKDGKKYDLLPPVCARVSKMAKSTICFHQFAVLDCHRWEEVRFVATSLCSIAKDGKKYDVLPPVCARLPEMGGSTICCHQFVLDCQRWEEVRLVATSLCPKMGRSTVCCHQFVLKNEKQYDLLPPVRFVAASLCSIVKDGKKNDLLPPVCARVSKMGRRTICCRQFVLDCQRWEEVRFVATSLCSIARDGKKYDLLPPVCARLSKMGRSTISCHQFVLKDGESTICCHHFAVLDCQRWEEVRFVATSLCSIVKDGKKHGLLPPVCGVLDCEIATSLCSIVKDGKKYDLLPPVCGTRLS